MITPDQSEELGRAAEDTLSAFDTISRAARDRLSDPPRALGSALAVQNAFTGERVLGNLGNVERAEREACDRLSREPAIARVIVENERKEKEVIYVARAASPTGGKLKVASYRSPLGRLASLEPEDTLNVSRGGVTTTLTVLQRALLKPEEDYRGWDALHTVFESLEFGPVTVESLRRLVDAAGGLGQAIDEIDRMLREEEAAAEIVSGLRKTIIVKMGLRDQPTLDKYQDEIFRLPLDSQLALLGAPGSGKTTTLIKRLGQKLDPDGLEASERETVQRAAAIGVDDQSHSWLMFAPTNLLRSYVKEAFAEEGVPAPDSRIQTWEDYQRQLGRTQIPVLHGGMSGGTWRMRTEAQTLAPGTVADTIAWFEDFDSWQKGRYWADLATAVETLSMSEDARVAVLSGRLRAALDTRESTPRRILRLVDLTGDVRTLLEDLRATVAKDLRATLNAHQAADHSFIDRLAAFMDTLSDPEEPDELDPDLDGEDDDEGEQQAQTPRARAVLAFNAALRIQARSAVTKRRVGRGRSGSILAWLRKNGSPQASLSEASQLAIGQQLVAQSALRRLAMPITGYVHGVARRYGAFRRSRRSENRWYSDAAIGRVASPHEMDIVLLAALRAGNELLIDQAVWRRIEEQPFAPIKQVALLHRNQILVDEVTDFSAVQLACMVALANPRIKSVFVCGDFNQRVTVWGLREKQELLWVDPALDIREVHVAYRQSRQLYEFSRSLAAATGTKPTDADLPENRDNEGVAPALIEGLSGRESTAKWLADRIAEIESAMAPGTGLPSTAVFVNTEDLVEPMARALDDALADSNLRAVPCLRGQVIGQEGNVRVFDVQHVKGLEFEAVFFLGVDQLAQTVPDLFDRYLYVGATRAATYLGLTCEGKLPPVLEQIREQFRTNLTGIA